MSIRPEQSLLAPSLTLRWLGAAGLELCCNGFTLLVDPYLTRLSLWKMFLGKAIPNESVIFKHLLKADAILVTHSHFDHCMDVPVIAGKFSAKVYGSHNTIMILKKSGVPQNLLKEVLPNDCFSAGPFRISVEAATHRPLPLLKNKMLNANIPPPQRAIDYIMDRLLAFRIKIDSITLLTDPGDVPFNLKDGLLFLNTLQKKKVICKILTSTEASTIIPIHWDNSFRSVSSKYFPPCWKFLPVNSFSMRALKKKVSTLSPQGVFFIPELFKTYPIDALTVHPRGEYGYVST